MTETFSDARRHLLRRFAAVAGSKRCMPAVVFALLEERLQFPRDHGAHPFTSIEWWYITGVLRDASGKGLGMQITFFRSRPRVQEANPSAFSPKQLLFAHAALSDPAVGHLAFDQRSARVGLGLAAAAEHTTDVCIDDWTLRGDGTRYHARIAARTFDFDLTFDATQAVLPQGQGGFSRKGPLPGEASFYYSVPHLSVSGSVGAGDGRHVVSGLAWLDHEWSNNYLGKAAAGWDWIGINLDDGGALMAFRIRDKRGGEYWAAATYRTAGGSVRTFPPREVRFEPLRRWRSPHTGVEYPVQMRVRAGDLVVELEPLLDDQELDSRGSTGAIYWEGAVHARIGGRVVGGGYLELTGYAAPLRL